MADDIFSKYVVQDEQPSAGSRALSGFLQTTPFNPRNILNAITHPLETAQGMMWNPLADLLKASQAGSVKEGLKTMARGVPFIGSPAVDAAERMAGGDVAGGLGELGGVASGFAVPEVAGRVPTGLKAVGRGAEAAGAALKKPVSLMGLAEAVKNPVAGGAVIGAPYALEYAGKGAQALGRGLEKLTSKPAAAAEEGGGSPNARGFRRQSTEVPYRHQGELPAVEAPAPAPGLTPIQQFYRDNPMGAGRMTDRGLGTSAPGNLSDLANVGKYKIEPEVPGYPDISDVSFEGSADYLPGESTPPPSAGGFGIEGPYDSPSLKSLRLLKNEQPLTDPGAELARRLGTPSDTDVLNSVVNRAKTGSWNSLRSLKMADEPTSAAAAPASKFNVVSDNTGHSTVYLKEGNRYQGSFDSPEQAQRWVSRQEGTAEPSSTSPFSNPEFRVETDQTGRSTVYWNKYNRYMGTFDSPEAAQRFVQKQ